MIVRNTKFKDLLIVKQKNNIDNRGILRETFSNKFLKNLSLNIVLHQDKMYSEDFTFKLKINNLSL